MAKESEVLGEEELTQRLLKVEKRAEILTKTVIDLISRVEKLETAGENAECSSCIIGGDSDE